MLIEDRFAGNRKEGATLSNYAMRFAPAEPEASVCFQPPDIAHAVPERIAVANLVQRIAVGPRDVLRRDDGTADDELSDFARRQFLRLGECGDRAVGDADYLPLDAGKMAADAGARARSTLGCRLGEHFAGGDRSDRQRFGRAVRRMD